MARTRYGRRFRTRRGRYGRYKYVNGRRVGFVGVKRRRSNRNYNRYFEKKYGIKNAMHPSKGRWVSKTRWKAW